MYCDKQKTCMHHPGGPVFHEGYKYWSCCKVKKKGLYFTATKALAYWDKSTITDMLHTCRKKEPPSSLSL